MRAACKVAEQRSNFANWKQKQFAKYQIFYDKDISNSLPEASGVSPELIQIGHNISKSLQADAETAAFNEYYNIDKDILNLLCI